MDLFAATTSVGRSAGECQRHLGGLAQSVHQPGTERDAAVVGFGRLIRHREDVGGLLPVPGNPQRPIGDSRPRLLRCSGSDNQTEMTCPNQIFVDLGVGRCTPDTPHRGRLADVVDLADESQDRDR